ncbi:hypothetical protein EYF80_004945 [Liparis tanakae]|uniref:Uncharacterized protein n=1 Tax=Liparis tanakae TaxID=230148 RepID=A0A4Z2J3Y1_9TELE|nr:hypothetical protein EYF80_004945 [Liparis tanakae]
MWGEREARKGGKWSREGDELRGVFSLAAIVIICSVVITALGVCCLDQTTDGGGQTEQLQTELNPPLQAAT